jgi:surface antigen
VGLRLALGGGALALLGACTTLPESTEPLYHFMSDQDVGIANATLDRALESTPSGSSVTWSNAASGHSGAIRPIRTEYLSTKKVYCREYEESLTIGRETETYRDRACRNDDGQWIPIDR